MGGPKAHVKLRTRVVSATPYSWSDRRNHDIGFAQPCRVLWSVHICVFGDGVQGKGRPSPASSMKKLSIVDVALFGQRKRIRVALCEWLRMKFCAGLLTMRADRGVPRLRV